MPISTGLAATKRASAMALAASTAALASVAGERPSALAIALRGRLPVERDAAPAGGDDVVGEAREADVDDGQRLLEQRGRSHGPAG